MLSAAATFSEWGQATGLDMLRAGAETAHANFLTQLLNFHGASLNWSRQKLWYLANDVTYRILREPGVTAVFKVRKPPKIAWPFTDDENGNLLVERVCQELDPSRDPPLTQHSFKLKQRAALRGAEAISAVLDYQPGSSDGSLERMVSRSYTWYAALQGVTGMGRVNAAIADITVNGDRRVLGAGSFLPT